MGGTGHPTIFKFIEQIKKEQSLSEGKMAKCEANVPAATSKKKYADRDAAILKAVGQFLDKIKQLNDDEGTSSEDEDELTQRDRASQRRSNPAMILINTIAHNTRL